jgi:hypothetical protein
MGEVGLSALADPLTSVARAVWPQIRRLRAERRAGQQPIFGESDLLDRSLDQALARLRAEGIDDAWWDALLNKLGHQYVAPDFLRAPALQDWLELEQVQADAKALARARIMGADADDPITRRRLAAAYSESTGETWRRAAGPIDVVVAVLAASHLSRLSGGFEALGAMMQAHSADTRAGVQRMDDRFEDLSQQIDGRAPDAAVAEALATLAEQALKPILERRSIVPERARSEVQQLADRAKNGDLRYASAGAREKILYWAARLLAAETETAGAARQCRGNLLQLDPAADTRIIDAFLAAAEGKHEDVFRAVRDLDDPDGRSTLFALLGRLKGDDAALSWLDEQQNDDPSLLTGVGWRIAACKLAMAGRWNEAADRLALLGETYLEECPGLAFAEGVINGAMLLPSDLRRHALETGLFFPEIIRPLQGPDADRRRSRAIECFARAAIDAGNWLAGRG